MECSCGSSKFTAARASVIVSEQSYQFEFSTCDGCGRRAGERLVDSERKLVAFGYEAVQWMQAESHPQERPSKPRVDGHSQSSNNTLVSSIHAHRTLKGPVAPGARNYFMWSADDYTVYVLYFHNITSNGHDTVHVPWLERSWDESAADGSGYIALQAFASIRRALAREFKRAVENTQCSVTCAPPRAIPLATRFAGDPIDVLFDDPIASENECVSDEAGQVIEITTPDAPLPAPARQLPEQVAGVATPVSTNIQADCQLTLF